MEDYEYQYLDINYAMMMLGDSYELYVDVAKAFCKNAMKQIDAMLDSIKSGDLEVYGRETHSLKSVSLNLGAKKLSELATKQNDAFKRENVDFIMDGYQELINLYHMTLHEIKSYAGLD